MVHARWNQGEVTHFGQTTFVGANKHGLFTDEEAPKKSLTDATNKALSMLGFGLTYSWACTTTRNTARK